MQRAGTSHSGKNNRVKGAFLLHRLLPRTGNVSTVVFVCFLTCTYRCKILVCKYCIQFLFKVWSSIATQNNKNSIVKVFGMSVFIFIFNAEWFFFNRRFLTTSGFYIYIYLFFSFFYLFIFLDWLSKINSSRCLNVTANHTLKVFSICSYQAKYLRAWLEWWQIFTFWLLFIDVPQPFHL